MSGARLRRNTCSLCEDRFGSSFHMQSSPFARSMYPSKRTLPRPSRTVKGVPILTFVAATLSIVCDDKACKMTDALFGSTSDGSRRPRWADNGDESCDLRMWATSRELRR